MINRVISISVIGNIFSPSNNSLLKYGITLPRELITFPYLTTAKRVSCLPDKLLAAINNLSEQSFVAPYKFMGLAALSVERAITFSYLYIWVVQRYTAEKRNCFTFTRLFRVLIVRTVRVGV